MYTRNEKVVPIYIEDEMKDSYISYAMSVIVGRALPDVRDGLKPVHRRILYAMQDLALEHNKPHKKCARIVGDTMGRYHPHGDVAIYDTLVRMVQDFSLRYPLIDGQGNFGCFTKDTKVRLADGRILTFGELIKEYKKGKRNCIFTFNEKDKKIEIAEITNPRLTRKKSKIIKVILDNGEGIKCTSDHPFMLRDGTYRNAKDLKPGDSLMPLYIKTFDGADDFNLKGYEVLYQPLQNSWEFIHHLADRWNLENKVYKKSAGRIRHHKDFNKLNNNPDNIERIQWGQHWQHHKEIARWRHEHDPEYVKNIAEGRKRFWADPTNRKKVSRRISEWNKRNWRNPLYRKKMSEFVQHCWQRPAYRKIITEASSKNLKKLWRKKEFRELLSKLKSEELKKRWQNQNYRDFIAEITRKTSLKIWSDPKHRIKISQSSKQLWQNDEYREKMISNLKKMWENPDFRNKYPADHFRKIAKKLWENPEIRELHSQKAKKQWEDASFREKIVNCIIERNKKRIKENPNLMKELTEKAKISLKEKWKEPLYKEKVLKSKILGFVNNLLKNNNGPTPELYEKERIPGSGVPRIENALRYFSNFEELVAQAKDRHNHKVVAIEQIDKKEDVYDLSIEPWHNFSLAAGIFVHNSIDGDAPAAMRYTEARLREIAEYMLSDIDKDTVDFMPNFDNSLQEPTVLPSALPNLLVNGSSGIAVGMATNIPPHNLREIIDGIKMVIDNPNASIKELSKVIKGPDFPTGGIICGRDGINNAYNTGRGLLKINAKANIETQKSGKESIIISEIPYQVNKSNLLEQIVNLVQDKKAEGISDIRDESDKDGTRIVIELRRGAEARVILNQLYKHTQMQVTFGVIMLALVDARPRVLNLKQMITEFIEHRKEIIRRRTRFDLNRAKARAHILEGLKIALSHIDEIVNLIKKSKSVDVAREQLIKKYKLSEAQAQAILEMQLQRLTGLEREKLDAEYLELIKKIELFESILKSEKKVLEIIKEELNEIAKKFGDERKTEVLAEFEDLEIEDLIAEEDMVITISHSGYIKRQPVSGYRKQRRGGVGVSAAGTKEEDFVEHLFIASTHDYILFFTDKGMVKWLKVHEVPQAGRLSKGKAIINLIDKEPGEEIASFVPVEEFKEGHFLVLATKQGTIKKTSLGAYSRPRRGGIIGINLDKGDRLIGADLTDGHKEIFLATKAGKAIRFSEKDVREMGRQATGVRGIRLSKNDGVVGMVIVKPDTTILTVTQAGFGKRTKISQYRKQSRGGKGTINIKITKKNQDVVGIKTVSEKDEIMMITQGGMMVRCPVSNIRASGRATQGVKLMSLKQNDRITSIALVVAKEEEAGNLNTTPSSSLV